MDDEWVAPTEFLKYIPEREKKINFGIIFLF